MSAQQELIAAAKERLAAPWEDDRRVVRVASGEDLGYRVLSGSEACERLLVLVHGMLGNAFVFDWLARHEAVVRAAEKHSYRVVAVEMRGFGRSSFRSPAGSHDAHGADLDSFVRALLGERHGRVPVVALGWSTGAPAVLSLAGRAQLAGVVCWGGVGAEGMDPAVARSTTRDADAARALVLRTVVRERDADMLSGIWLGFVGGSRRPPPPEKLAVMLRAAFEQREECVTDASWCNCQFNATDAAVADADGSGRERPGSGLCARIACPVLVVHGEKDLTLSLESAARKTHRATPGSRLVVVPGGAHDLTDDGVDVAAGALADFLAEVAAKVSML